VATTAASDPRRAAMSLYDLHEALAWFLVVTNALVGIWALLAQYRPGLRTPVLWWSIGVAEVSTFAIAVVGVLMVNRYDIELDQFHALYGFSTIVAVGILYSYRGSPFVKDKVHLLYGVGSLFIMGLGIRAMYLGTEALQR
jgi:hypothetical protein